MEDDFRTVFVLLLFTDEKKNTLSFEPRLKSIVDTDILLQKFIKVFLSWNMNLAMRNIFPLISRRE